MNNSSKSPRILIVTPEVTYLPKGMGDLANYLSAKAGGLADVSAALITALFEHGADVHVALPNYRSLFNSKPSFIIREQEAAIRKKIPEERIHLAEDRAFFYLNQIYSDQASDNIRVSVAFQREVINNIVPAVQPDLIHCNDWMTGFIPAMARQMGIPCLFTLHNIYSVKCLLSEVEDRGIDVRPFWQKLYFERMPVSYEETRYTNPVDFLTSGVFASHFVNTVSPTFLKEIIQGQHSFIEPWMRQELTNKWNEGCAFGILNAPDPGFNPLYDKVLVRSYGAEDHYEGKRANKNFLQRNLGLIEKDTAPLFFWPSRLDSVQKGSQLLLDILDKVTTCYSEQDLEIIFVANGEFQSHFRNIVTRHRLEDRVAVLGFDEELAHLAYAASDFVFMPSRFEPCGLPQMIAPIYGSLPIARDTGGIHDTIKHMDVLRNTGNGFLFKTFDANGLSWAIDQAMCFYLLPQKIKKKQISRIMKESAETFNHAVTARKYMELYEKMLHRPLIVNSHIDKRKVA